MFISTMLVTYFAQGALFSAGIMKSTMLSGLSVAVYAVVVRWTFLPLDLIDYSEAPKKEIASFGFAGEIESRAKPAGAAIPSASPC